MRLRTILLVLTLLTIFSVTVGGSLHYASHTQAARDEAKRNADAQTNTLTNLVASFLATNQQAVAALAAMRPLPRALAGADPATLEAAHAVLDRFQQAFAASACYLMDREGTTVASSNRNDPDSFVGSNYAFRDYFQQAIQGVPTLALARGVTSQKRGIYCSHPVYAAQDDTPVGVVVLKAPIEALEHEFGQDQEGIVLLTDPQGVIFASNRQAWVYRSLWETTPGELAQIAETRLEDDNRQESAGLRSVAEGHAVDHSGREYLVSQSAIQNGTGWQVVYLMSPGHAFRGIPGAFMHSSGTIVLVLFILVGAAVTCLYRIACKDIAQRRVAEEALRESEERYRSLFQNNHAVMLLIDPESGRIVDANPAACAYYGYSPAQLRALSMADINTLTPAELFEAMARAKAEQCRHFLFQHRLANGEVRPVEVYSGPIALHGKKLLYSVVHDITERKRAQDALRESEERFRQIAELSPFPMAIIETDGRYLFLNRKFVEVFGYGLAAIPTGKEWFRLAFPDPLYRKEVIATWVADLEKSAKYQVRPREFIVCCRDGKFRTILFRPVTIEGHRQFITYEDLTEQRRVEQERLRLAKLESVGLLAGGIAHDFNNLLTAIIGNISLARLQVSRSEQLIATLGEAEQAAARAKELTLQLLTFSKGGVPVKKAMALAGVIQESCRLMLSGSKSRCEVDLAPDLWWAEVDAGQISQAVTNVILNADQAMPAGGTIRVRAANYTAENGDSLPLEPGPYLRVAIADEGVGIGSEQLTRIFDPYFTTKQSGSGLGLATVHSIVSKHGGYVTAASEPGQGTTITIYLPAVRSAGGVQEQPVESEVVDMGQGKILVMDDEVMIRELAAAMLAHLGYEVGFAENGEQAIDRYQQAQAAGAPFDAVLMDLTIRGGMGGREAVAALRALDPQVKAIVSSGYSHDPVMAEFKDYGFVGVVAKPYRIEELSKVLQSVLATTA